MHVKSLSKGLNVDLAQPGLEPEASCWALFIRLEYKFHTILKIVYSKAHPTDIDGFFCSVGQT